MKASDIFIQALENEGVEYIFGIPGEENLDFLESLQNSKIQLVITRHEQAAGFMAANYGRLTGKPGVCISTLGPGATNLVTAAAYAQLGAMPLIMITGQKPVKKSKQGSFQVIDVVQMMTPITKMSKQIVTAHSIPALVRKAFRTAEEERPGAVHLELPEDIAEENTDAEIFSAEKLRRPIAEAKAIQKAVEMIEQAKSPLLLIGAGANRKLTSKMLTSFVEKTGIPFFHTQMGKGVLDERHPLYLGTAALSDKDILHCAVDQADLIINIGHDTVEKPPFIMKRDSAKVIHINFNSATVDEVYFPQHEVIGDIANAIWQIQEKITVQKHWIFSYFLDVKQKLEKDIYENLQNSFPITPRYLVQAVRNIIPEDGIVSLDNGVYKLWFARNYKAYQANTLLLDNALATMGAGLPAAMAAKIVYPDKKVLAVCGDGGFMMNSQEIETALRLKLNLVILILNDGAYEMVRWKQRNKKYQDFGLRFNNPDFVKYAESYGAKGYRIKNAEELENLLKTVLNQDGVHIIDVPIDYSENDTRLTQLIENNSCNF